MVVMAPVRLNLQELTELKRKKPVDGLYWTYCDSFHVELFELLHVAKNSLFVELIRGKRITIQ